MAYEDDSPVTVWDDVRTAQRIAVLLASRELQRPVTWDEFEQWRRDEHDHSSRRCYRCWADSLWDMAVYLGREL